MSAQHTPGPWRWMGNQHDIYLATEHSGRLYVMGFKRMGMQTAQPVFRGEHHMVPAADLVQFEVGDGTARGFANGRSDDSVYRYDIKGIDCPDARLIAAAPELLEALIQSRAVLVTVLAEETRETAKLVLQRRIEAASAAISKARGGAA